MLLAKMFNICRYIFTKITEVHDVKPLIYCMHCFPLGVCQKGLEKYYVLCSTQHPIFGEGNHGCYLISGSHFLSHCTINLTIPYIVSLEKILLNCLRNVKANLSFENSQISIKNILSC